MFGHSYKQIGVKSVRNFMYFFRVTVWSLHSAFRGLLVLYSCFNGGALGGRVAFDYFDMILLNPIFCAAKQYLLFYGIGGIRSGILNKTKIKNHMVIEIAYNKHVFVTEQIQYSRLTHRPNPDGKLTKNKRQIFKDHENAQPPSKLYDITKVLLRILQGILRIYQGTIMARADPDRRH